MRSFTSGLIITNIIIIFLLKMLNLVNCKWIFSCFSSLHLQGRDIMNKFQFILFSFYSNINSNTMFGNNLKCLRIYVYIDFDFFYFDNFFNKTDLIWTFGTRWKWRNSTVLLGIEKNKSSNEFWIVRENEWIHSNICVNAIKPILTWRRKKQKTKEQRKRKTENQ